VVRPFLTDWMPTWLPLIVTFSARTSERTVHAAGSKVSGSSGLLNWIHHGDWGGQRPPQEQPDCVTVRGP
jgi:hypothetical protein